MITKAVRKILMDAGITAGIHSGRALQNEEPPYIRLNSSKIPERCHEGIGMYVHSVQIDVFSKSFKEAATIALAVEAALEGYTGTAQGITIRDSQFVNAQDGFSDLEDIEMKIIEFELTTNS